MKSRYLTDVEIKAIFKQMPKDKRLIFEVCLITGMRIGDCLKIRCTDLKTVDGKFGIRYTAEKTGKSAFAPIEDDKIALQLSQLAKENRRLKFIFPSLKSGSGHITRQAAWAWFKTAAKNAKVDIEGCTVHSLRKCYAVEIRNKSGVDAAQKALQHKQKETTFIYAYADAYAGYAPQEPILWGQVDQLVDLLKRRMEYE